MKIDFKTTNLILFAGVAFIGLLDKALLNLGLLLVVFLGINVASAIAIIGIKFK